MMSFHYDHLQASTEEEFVSLATLRLTEAMQSAITQHGRCTIGLSGGSTPRDLYSALGSSKKIDWTKVHLFLVDERHVPLDHKDSNQRLVRETLLMQAKIPPAHFLFPDTTLPIDQCVGEYETEVRELFRDAGPDIVILGLGPDGHIASLFPGDIDALLEQEHDVLHTTTDHFAVHDRITVTLPLLTRASLPLFLLKGEEKKKIFAETLSANIDPIEHPAHALLETGKTVWVTFW